MKTTEYYLRQLQYYKTLLVSQLQTQGVECDETETYNSLIDKIYKLAKEDNIEIENYTIANYQGSEEDVDYILSHAIPTAVQTSMINKFKNVPNMRKLPLYRFNLDSNTYGLGLMFDSADSYNTGRKPAPITELDAHGCNLTGSCGARKGEFSSYHDDFGPNLKKIILDDATINPNILRVFTNPKTFDWALEEVSFNNTIFNSGSFYNCFYPYSSSYPNKTLKSIDLSNAVFSEPITRLRDSFGCMSNLESIKLPDSFEFADVAGYIQIPGYKTAIKELPFPLSKLDGKVTSYLSIAYLEQCEVRDITLNCTIGEDNKEQTSGLTICGMPYLQNLDLSNATLSDKPFAGFSISGNSTKLTAEELQNMAVKLPDFRNKNIQTITLRDLPTLKNVDFTNLSCRDHPRISNTGVEILDYRQCYYTGYSTNSTLSAHCNHLANENPNLKEFYICETGTNIPVFSFESMLYKCPSLEKVVVNGFKSLYNYTDKSPDYCYAGMFASGYSERNAISGSICMPNLHTLDLTGCTFDSVLTWIFKRYIRGSSTDTNYFAMPNLTNFIVTDSDNSHAETLAWLLAGCTQITSVDLGC